MPDSARDVALVEVVRPHADLHQTGEELLERFGIVVHAAQQDALVAERDARVGELRAGARRIGRDFLRVVEMGVEPERLVPLQHRGQGVRDAHGHHHGRARADADHLHVRDGPQAPEHALNFGIRQHERVPAGKQHVPHLAVGLDVGVRPFELFLPQREILAADQPAPRAVPAVHRAPVRQQQQHAVRVPVHQPRHGGIGVLAQGVGPVAGLHVQLPHGGDGLLPDGAFGVRGVHQRGVVRRDRHAEMPQAPLHARLLIGRKRQNLRQLFRRGHAAAHLPAPVVPFFGRHAGPRRFVPEGVHRRTACLRPAGTRPYRLSAHRRMERMSAS